MGAVEYGAGFIVTNTNDPGNGVCAPGACTLREAITAANNDAPIDTVTFDASVSGTLLLDIGSHGNIDITDELTLTGPGMDQLTISGGDVAPGSERGGIFRALATASLITLSDLTLTQGRSIDYGGAVFSDDDLTLNRVRISDSHATVHGGGFYASGDVNLTDTSIVSNVANLYAGGFFTAGKAVLTDSVIAGNRAGNNSGGFLAHGKVVLTDSVIADNYAGHNSGGFRANGDVILTKSRVVNNEAAGFRGGFFVSTGDATLEDSSVSGNTAGSSEGGFFVQGDVTLIRSLVSGNTSGGSGGGGLSSGTITATNSTISGNTTAASGGGLFAYDGIYLHQSTVTGNTASGGNGGGLIVKNATDPIQLENSIVADNTAGGSGPDIYNGAVTSSYSLLGVADEGPNSFTDTGGSLTGVAANPYDPALAPLADNGGPTATHALLPASPAIDAAEAADCTSTDQRGLARPQPAAGDCDMGAFEAALADTDGDGSPYGEEITNGTDPNNPDTDNDGLDDSLDTDPLTAICTGANPTFGPNTVFSGDTDQCAGSVSVTVPASLAIQVGGRAEVFTPLTKIQTGFSVPLGAEFAVEATGLPATGLQLASAKGQDETATAGRDGEVGTAARAGMPVAAPVRVSGDPPELQAPAGPVASASGAGDH